MSNSRRCVDLVLDSDLSDEIFNSLDQDSQLNLGAVNRRYVGLFGRKNHIQSLLTFVAHGNEANAARWLDRYPDLSLACGDVTDYSGRTFKNITAYEYAYWAGDWRMLDMMSERMTPCQKAQMLQKINVIEHHGLSYMQNRVTKNSKHFSLQPLIEKYNNYLRAYLAWDAIVLQADPRRALAQLNQIWLEIGLVQRELPAYLIQEYCRSDKNFTDRTEFNDRDLPRTFNFYSASVNTDQSLLPLDMLPDYRLGFEFILFRWGCLGSAQSNEGHSHYIQNKLIAECDLAAICNIDRVSVDKLMQSLDNLRLTTQQLLEAGATLT